MRALHQSKTFDKRSRSVTADLFVIGNAKLRASALCLDRVHPAWQILVVIARVKYEMRSQR